MSNNDSYLVNYKLVSLEASKKIDVHNEVTIDPED
jgi:hypothetical protein